MTRDHARAGLFISIAAALTCAILRTTLADLAYAGIYDVEGWAPDFSWARFFRSFFADRWALEICALSAVFFAYRLLTFARSA